MELKHLKSIEGSPRPADVFQPHLPSVELFSDMDELFNGARKMAAGEHAALAGESAEVLKEGERGVVIVTPGRLHMFDRCPEPGSVPEEKVEAMREMLPPDPPLRITAISYTYIEALVEDMSKAIPFRGFLNAWAYLGHNVIVFEGHPSAFESGVRDSDVLLVDSGMQPFLQPDWQAVAQRVMPSGGRILIHDRETYTLSQVIKPEPVQPQTYSGPVGEEGYVVFLLWVLVGAARGTIELTSGCVLPKLADLATKPEPLAYLAIVPFKEEDLDVDKVIDIILHKAGWRLYSPFKTNGKLRLPMLQADGTTKHWTFDVTLGKDAHGRRQVEIVR